MTSWVESRDFASRGKVPVQPLEEAAPMPVSHGLFISLVCVVALGCRNRPGNADTSVPFEPVARPRSEGTRRRLRGGRWLRVSKTANSGSETWFDHTKSALNRLAGFCKAKSLPRQRLGVTYGGGRSDAFGVRAGAQPPTHATREVGSGGTSPNHLAPFARTPDRQHRRSFSASSPSTKPEPTIG